LLEQKQTDLGWLARELLHNRGEWKISSQICTRQQQ
jgi:hypothetical protein